MGKMNLFLSAGITFLLFSCKASVSPELFTEKEKALIQGVESLKDIYIQKEVIPLQQVRDRGYFTDFKINEHLILGLRYDRGEHQVFVWNKDGVFLGRAGGPGKAPGEYVSVGGFDFTGDHSFLIFDRVRAVINFYETDNDSVCFIEQKDADLNEQTYMDTLFFAKDSFYLLSCSGPAGVFTLFKLDDHFKITQRFHKRKKVSPIANPTYAISEDLIYVLGPFDNDFKMLEPFIYVYSMDGKLFRKIRTKYRDIFDINFDRSGKLIFITSMKNIFDLRKADEYRILDLQGNVIHTFSSLPPLAPESIMGISRTCRSHENAAYLTRPDKNRTARLYLYDIDLGLAAEGGKSGK